MITFLRDHAQSWLIKGLLLIIVVTFIVSFGVGTFSNTKEVMVTVGDREILVQDYVSRYQRQLEQMRSQFGENTERIAQQINLRQQVYDNMINQHLILISAEEQGLRVTPEELQATVLQQPVFHADGRFDRSRYLTVLRQNELTPAQFEGGLREDLMVEKYQRNLLAGLVVSDREIDQRFRINHEQVTVNYILVDPARFSQGIQATPEAVQAYYEQHSGEFQQPVRVKLEYFVLSTKQLEESSSVHDRSVERYYERNRDTQYTTPMRVHARHILKQVPADATPEQEAAARQAAEQLRQQALQGADFAKLAREHSDGPTAKSGGDLGFFRRDEMVPAFADVAFALEPGQTSEVVRSQFGFHVIRVVAVEPAKVKPLDEVRKDIEAELLTARAERKLELESERLPQRMEQEGMAAVAQSLGVTVQQTDWIDGTGVLPQLGSTAPLYQAVANAQTGRTGVLRRNPIQGHVFYRVSDRQEAHTKPLDEVRGEARAKVREQQAIEAAAEAAKAALKTLKQPADFAAFARRHGLTVKSATFTATARSIPELGVNSDFQHQAFRLGPEQPFGLSIREREAYLLQFAGRSLPQGEEADKLRQQIGSRIRQEWAQYFMANEIERLKAQIPVQLEIPELLLAGS